MLDQEYRPRDEEYCSKSMHYTNTNPTLTQRQFKRSLLDLLVGFGLATAFWAFFSSTFVSKKHVNPFPSNVGYSGPIVTGVEPFAAATAPAVPEVEAYFPLVRPIIPDQSKSFDPIRYWGSLSPFHSLPPDQFGLSKESSRVPPECKIKQMHLLHRHGARYPTTSGEPKNFVGRIKNATEFKAHGQLAFLNNFEYKLGEDLLTPFGRSQLFNLGSGFRQKYGHLLNHRSKSGKKLVFRTTSQNRMMYSAYNFAAGFFGIPYEDQYHQSIIIEASGFKNSLAPQSQCPRHKVDVSNTDTILKSWTDVWLAEPLKRLQKLIEGYELTSTDVFSMMKLCAYETVALSYSAFCPLFTEEDFIGFEYAYDVTFWYAYSFGAPSSAAVGMGWVQELVARLTKTPISNHKFVTNSTLDDNPVTFPLDQAIYVDATHDTVISAILVSLNMTSLAALGPLPTTHRPKEQTFVTSHIAPFAANLQAQVINCGSKDHIRFLLNDAPLPMTGIRGCTDHPLGFCPVEDFVKAMKSRIEEIDFAYDCGSDYSYIPPQDGGGIVDGRPPARSEHRGMAL